MMNCQFCRSPLPKKARVCLTCGNLTPTDKAGAYQENDRGSGPGMAIAIFLGMVVITSIMLVMAFNELLAHSKSYLPVAGEDIMVVVISIGTATTSLIIVVIGIIALLSYGKGRHPTVGDAITAIAIFIGTVMIIFIILAIGFIALQAYSKSYLPPKGDTIMPIAIFLGTVVIIPIMVIIGYAVLQLQSPVHVIISITLVIESIVLLAYSKSYLPTVEEATMAIANSIGMVVIILIIVVIGIIVFLRASN